MELVKGGSGPYFCGIKNPKHRGRPSAPVGGPSQEGGLFAMTRKELSDNLSFLSALKMLEGLAAAGKLTNEEKEKAREELERRLRPTLLFA